MNKEDLVKEQKKIAEFLFDGDPTKAEQLLILIKSFILNTDDFKDLPEFQNLKMKLPED